MIKTFILYGIVYICVMKKIDANSIVGNTYNKWTVLSTERIIKSNRERIYCLCKCECGNAKSVLYENLVGMKTFSCGCHLKNIVSELHKKHGFSNKNNPEYNSWTGMRGRCNNPTNPKYGNYGARGIVVCERWNDFALFLLDMGKKPKGKYTIDRIDVNGNYEPSNCRWATDYTQFRNRTDNHWVELKGEKMIMSDWCKKYNISTGAVYVRLKCGWDFERAITSPIRPHKKYS